MKIFIEYYGCTANKSDVSIAKYQINESNNHNLVKTVNSADAILLFTCTVISSTEQRMLSKIKKYHKMGKKIIVSGCMASIQKEIILKLKIPVIFISPRKIHNIIHIIEKSLKLASEENKYLANKSFDSLIAPISISEGCDFACNYCITTIARGKLTSYPAFSIENDIKNALNNGCREIQLTAQDTASYGKDINLNLATLLGNLSKINGSYKIRVGMMNPKTLYPQLNQMIKAFKNKHIYNFLHIPVQSGDDEILKKMNRNYTVDQFKTIIKKFKEKHQNLTISTDVIIGFPTETDEQFEKTIRLIKEVKPDIVNITKFSARPFTKAKEMKGRIPTDIVKNRSQLLTKITEKVSLEKNKQYIGKTYNILINEKGKYKTVVGRSENYKPVVIKKPLALGEFVDIKVTDAKQTYLVGMLK